MIAVFVGVAWTMFAVFAKDVLDAGPKKDSVFLNLPRFLRAVL